MKRALQWFCRERLWATIAPHESPNIDPAGRRGDARRARLRLRLLLTHGHIRRVAQLDRGRRRTVGRTARGCQWPAAHGLADRRLDHPGPAAELDPVGAEL